MKRKTIILSVLAVIMSACLTGQELYAEDHRAPIVNVGQDSVDSADHVVLRLLDSASYAKNKQRPTVGVVLSGGGAKGSAHIGVLKVLEEVGIPVDFIAGTSMGSIIGGLYAVGYSAGEMDSLISNMDWSIYMSNKVHREQLSYLDKERRGRYVLIVPFNTTSSLEHSLEMGQGSREQMSGETSERMSKGGGNVFVNSLPAGFINGNNIESLLSTLCAGYEDSVDFNALPIPYACVASDMVSGQEIVFHSGNLPLAIRASMAIPGVFAPVRTDGMVLIDGGMQNNFPVDVCKEMGADIIIGIRVSSEINPSPEDLNSLPEIVGQLMGVTSMQKSKDNIQMCDLFIEPDISGFGPMSFDKKSIDELIRRGYTEGNAHRAELEALKRFLDGFEPLSDSSKALPAAIFRDMEVKVDSYTFTGIGEKDGEWLIKKSRLWKHEKVGRQDLDDAVNIMYGTSAFSKITYSVEKSDSTDGYTVHFKMEKAQPHNLSLGMRFDSREAAAILAHLGINEQKLTGFKFDLTTKLSFNPWATVRISLVPRVVPRFSLSYTFRKSEANFTTEGTEALNLRYYRHLVKAYFSEYHSRNFNVEVGMDFDNYRHNWELEETSYLGLYGIFNMDNRDKGYLATKGTSVNLSGHWKFHDFGTGIAPFRTFGIVAVNAATYIPLAQGRFVVAPQLYSRFVIGPGYGLPYMNIVGDVMPGRYYEHQIPFVGTITPEVMYNSLVVLRTDFRVNVYRKHYVSAMVNYMRESDDLHNFFVPVEESESGVPTAYNWWGVGLRYSYDLPFGPLDVDVSWSNLSRKVGVYLNLGYYF